MCVMVVGKVVDVCDSCEDRWWMCVIVVKKVADGFEVGGGCV